MATADVEAQRDPRWENVSGGVQDDPNWPGQRRLEINIRRNGERVGSVHMLEGDNPGDFAKALAKMVRAIDEMLHA